ncbi:MAG: hypothetical protein KF746_22355 [Chitinophagaceae bacterium]|nr:hypothetical protein [Chitinophagaceae bacterium]
MRKYYRFQNEAPKIGESVHVYISKNDFLQFVRMMKTQDRQFHRMKFWEIEGIFLRHDDEDAVVRVTGVQEIKNV